MGLLPNTHITINSCHCQGNQNSSFETLILEHLKEILMSLQTLSKEVGELRTQVTDLKAAIDTEQQQVADAVGRLNTTIATLQEQIANGATPQQLQAVADEIVAVRNDLAAAKEDLASTIADEPTDPGTGTETPGEGNEPPTGSPSTGTEPDTGAAGNTTL